VQEKNLCLAGFAMQAPRDAKITLFWNNLATKIDTSCTNLRVEPEVFSELLFDLYRLKLPPLAAKQIMAIHPSSELTINPSLLKEAIRLCELYNSNGFLKKLTLETTAETASAQTLYFSHALLSYLPLSETRFNFEKYNPHKHPHLQKVYERRPDLQNTWPKPLASCGNAVDCLSRESLWKASLIKDNFLSPDSAFTGSGFVADMIQAKTRILSVFDPEKNTPLCTLRLKLLLDSKENPVLYLDNVYPHAPEESSLKELMDFLVFGAKTWNLPVFIKGSLAHLLDSTSPGISASFLPLGKKTLSSIGSPEAYEYVHHTPGSPSLLSENHLIMDGLTVSPARDISPSLPRESPIK